MKILGLYFYNIFFKTHLELLTNIDQLSSESYVATIGFFDGVHLGHRFLLQGLKEKAAELGKKSLVISFDSHPKTVISSDFIPSLLTSNTEKIDLMREIGVDAFVLLHFDKSMAEFSARDFLDKVILKQLGVHTLLIGYDNRFGKNREEGYNDYVRYGKELGINIMPVKSYNNDEVHISSTVIRNCLNDGKVDEAASCLGRLYNLKGKIIFGERLGSKIGFPTANLQIIDMHKLIPALGVYAVRVNVHDQSYKGMLNIGKRPTVSQNEKVSVEVHILDFEGDIYGELVEILFVKRVRDEVKFSSVDDLVIQLGKDKQFVQQLDY